MNHKKMGKIRARRYDLHLLLLKMIRPTDAQPQLDRTQDIFQRYGTLKEQFKDQLVSLIGLAIQTPFTVLYGPPQSGKSCLTEMLIYYWEKNWKYLKLNGDILKLDCEKIEITFDEYFEQLPSPSSFSLNEYSLMILDDLDKIEKIKEKNEMEKLLKLMMQIQQKYQFKVLLVMSESLFNSFKEVQQQFLFENFNFNHYKLADLTKRDALLFFIQQLPSTKALTPNLTSLLKSIQYEYENLVLNSSMDRDLIDFLDVCARYPRLLETFEELRSENLDISICDIAKLFVDKTLRKTCKDKGKPIHDFAREFRRYQVRYEKEQRK